MAWTNAAGWPQPDPGSGGGGWSQPGVPRIGSAPSATFSGGLGTGGGSSALGGGRSAGSFRASSPYNYGSAQMQASALRSPWGSGRAGGVGGAGGPSGPGGPAANSGADKLGYWSPGPDFNIPDPGAGQALGPAAGSSGYDMTQADPIHGQGPRDDPNWIASQAIARQGGGSQTWRGR